MGGVCIGACIGANSGFCRVGGLLVSFFFLKKLILKKVERFLFGIEPSEVDLCRCDLFSLSGTE